MAAPVHTELGMGDRCVNTRDQLCRFPAKNEELALHAGDAENRAGNARDTGPVQEVFDDRSAPEKNAGRNDGTLPAPRNQPHDATERMSANADADADLVGPVARADG